MGGYYALLHEMQKHLRGFHTNLSELQAQPRSAARKAAELALLFEQNAVRHAIHPVKGGFSTSVYDPEYLPTDKDIYVEYQDLERAKELMLKEREEQSQEKTSEEDDMPRGKRMLIQSLSVIAFMAIVILVVLGSDFIANLLKALFTK